jgi:hypothetical protein
MSDIIQVKYKIMDKLSELPVFRKISNTQYRIRCPICGDSQKNLNEAHMYLKCILDDDSPILYNCFKGNCNAHGKIDSKFLKLLNISIPEMNIIDNRLFKRIPSVKDTDINILSGSIDINSDQVGYIEYRLGKGLAYDDYDKFKIVWDMNELRNFIPNNRIKNILPNNRDSISFLSDDKSTLLTRFFNNDDSPDRWKKIKLFNTDNKSFYTIKNVLDLFTPDRIVINIAEGVFDILSAYKHFNTGDNSAYISCLGADYESALSYAITKGLIGSNVSVNVYIDSDIDEKLLQRNLKKYKWLFNSISILRNVIEKDIGFSEDKIQLKKYEL